jgi:uncharacterized repeat protein (TIGR01451 family)
VKKNVTKKLKLLIAALILALISCGAVSAADSSNDDSDVEAQLMNVSVPFVENQGQKDSEVSYYANTFYGTSYITQDGITHQIIGEDNKTLVVKEQFLDSNGNPITFQAQGEEPSPTVVSYFKGNNPDNWQTNLPTYNFINLGQLYPGITVKLRATGSNIEKFFFVSPGANPDDIKIRVLGADQLAIDEEGNLIIRSEGFPDVSMSQPIAFQENNNNIDANYQVKDNTYGFKIGDYDHNQQLTIDPALVYSTYLGGYNYDFGTSIAVDSSGNTYITGYTDSTDFPTTLGAYQTSHAGSYYYDAFVSKLNPTGTGLVYSTYLGGSGGYDGNDYGHSIAVDGSGNAYITGQTYSTDFPTTPGAYQTSLSAYYDAFVTKLNPTGTGLVYSTYLGGNMNDMGYSLVVDGSGNAYITGQTQSTNFPTTLGAYQTSRAGSYDAFVSKLNSAGTGLVYSTYLGGTYMDYGNGVAVDSSGNAYITGYTFSENFPTTLGAYQTSRAGSYDAFVSKLNSAGTGLVYSTYLGGTSNEEGNGVAVDSSGNAYITGYTDSTNFPTTLGAYQTSRAGSYDAFVSKLNPTGTALEYSTYLGGTSDDYGNGVAVDGDGNAYITGYTDSTNFPTTSGAYQTSLAGYTDALMSKLNSAGTGLVYSTYLGGNYDNDVGNSIAVDEDANAYITGYTYSGDFPTTLGAYQTSLANGYDALVAKISTVNPLANVTVSKTGNGPLNVGDTGTFTVSLHNDGPDAANNVLVTDVDVPAGWTVTPSVGSWDPNTNTWNVGTLNNGASATLTISGTVTSVMAGTTITNTVTESQDEQTQETQTATASITVNSLASKADLYINSWSTKNNPNVGEIYTITFKLGNRGPDTAENVVFTLPLPDGVEFVDVDVDQGTATYDPATRTITWTLGDVVVGDPYAWVRVRSLNVGSFLFRPTLTTDTDDPNIESSIQTVTVNVQAAGGSSETVHAQTVPMQTTGTPLIGMVLAILMVLGGLISTKKH